MSTRTRAVLFAAMLGLGMVACGDDDGGGNNNNTPGDCGDGLADGTETCDGTDVRGNDCTTIGESFTGGTLGCNATCDGWDTSACTEDADCGNDQVEGLELCDGVDTDGEDCTTLGLGYTGGTLACNGTCDDWDLSGCTGGTPVCGNDTVEATELCDGVDTDGEDCTTLGMNFVSGTLACNGTCDDWDLSGCNLPVCGNDTAEASELCDGTDLAGNDCTTIGQGFVGGSLACSSACDGWNAAGCVGGVPVCGNGKRDGAEQCDGADLAGNVDCTDFFFTGGALSCNADCTFNFSACVSGIAGWTCRPDYYGDTFCDCGCGILDSDCADAQVGTCQYCDAAGGCNGLGGDCPGIIDPTSNPVCTAAVCGNNALEGSEQCDGLDYGGAACTDFGFTGGNLTCLTTCLFDFSGCTQPVCGNGTVEGWEQCDDGNTTAGDGCDSICLWEGTVVTESEPNDDHTTADGPFTTNTIVSASVGAAGDFDYYAVTVPAGATITVTVGDGGTGACTALNLDSEVEIYDTDGTSSLAFNDDIDINTNWCSTTSYTVGAAGTYFVRVSSSQTYAPNDTFSYELTIVIT